MASPGVCTAQHHSVGNTLSFDLLKSLQCGMWLVFSSQVKLSTAYANLITCQRKQSFVGTEVQQLVILLRPLTVV